MEKIKKKYQTFYNKYIMSKRTQAEIRRLYLNDQQLHIETLQDWQNNRKIYKGTDFILGDNKFFYIGLTFGLSAIWHSIDAELSGLYHFLWWLFAVLVILLCSYEFLRFLSMYWIKKILRKLKIIKNK